MTNIKKKKEIDKSNIDLSDFEKNVARLSEIANNLEQNSLSLDESFKEFSEGSEIAARINKQLNLVSEKVTEIIKKNKSNFGNN